MKIIALFATLLTVVFAADYWYLDYTSFNGVDQSFMSRYWLRGKYGPNNMGWFGRWAYIYLEVGGDEIAGGAIVAPWATIFDVDYWDTSTNTTHVA